MGWLDGQGALVTGGGSGIGVVGTGAGVLESSTSRDAAGSWATLADRALARSLPPLSSPEAFERHPTRKTPMPIQTQPPTTRFISNLFARSKNSDRTSNTRPCELSSHRNSLLFLGDRDCREHLAECAKKAVDRFAPHPYLLFPVGRNPRLQHFT
mgnify:CR=1 FL=1